MNVSVPNLTCTNCAHENLPDAKFCQNCGQPLLRACPNCNTLNEVEAKFCRNCGHSFQMIGKLDEAPRLKTLQDTAPQDLQEKIKVASSAIEGERKPVTILFADIVGSTSIAEKLDPEEWKEVVSGVHHRVSEAIYHYEGTIAQLLGDGVLAFFGAPITHEDDPLRAVHAALDIQDAIAEYERDLKGLVDQLQMRIGINSGDVVIGEIGTDLHMEYLAIGDAVNIAARLQSSAAPGKILLSENSARLVKAAFDLRDMGEIEVKGKEQPIKVFEVVDAKASPESGRGIEGLSAPLVGRHLELEKVEASLAALHEGRGQIFVLMGEAGIGKSRLIEEVKARSDGSLDADSSPPSIRWFEGRSLSYGSTLSFWTITQLIFADLGLSYGAPEAKISAALRRRVADSFAEDFSEMLPFLLHLMGVKLLGEENELLKRLDGETLKRQTLLSVHEYFANVAKERPTVLVFEDLHWADPSSLAALEHLFTLTDRAPIMILMITRIDREHGSWKAKIKAETDFAHRYSEIILKRLSDVESDQLVNHLLEIAQLPDKVRNLIMDRSEGNPFYLEEIIRNLIDQGAIQHENNEWRATERITEITIPDTLHGVLLARIDRLEEDVRHTLQLASVIGRSFMYRLLEAIAAAERQLDAHLAQLQRSDLVREKARWPELEYIFKHSLTQEAAYQSLLVERRKGFHSKVGEAIEELFPDRQQEFYGLLAHHFEAAEAWEKAVNYLLLVGDKARLEDAHKEAIDYYQRALKILASGDGDNEARAARTWLKLGLIHQINFDFDEAREANEQAFALKQQARSQREIGPVHDRQEPRILRFSLNSKIRSLDPGKTLWVPEGFFIQWLFAGLVEIDAETNVVPHVAHSWEVLDGGRKYVFHLREDVNWTDGAPVTAGDFERGWKRNLTPETDAFFARLLDDIVGARDFRLGNNSDPKSVGVRALDAKTLEVRLNSPKAYFIYLMAQGVAFPLPRRVVERYGDDWWKPEHIVSNGAFRLEELQEAGGACSRNPDYFDEFSGNLDGFEWYTIENNEEAIKEKYLEGGADVLWNVAETKIPADLPQDQVYQPPYFHSVFSFVFNPELPPLDDLRVRKALAHAMDLERLLEPFRGAGRPPPRGGLLPLSMPGHSPELGLEHNLDLAQRYLAEAGYPEGKGFPALTVRISPTTDPRGPLEHKRQMREGLGVEIIHIKTASKPTFLELEQNAHIMPMSWIADYPDPDNFLHKSLIIVSLRRSGWTNAHYEELIEQAAISPDRAQRLAFYRQADRILVNEEVLVYPLFYGAETNWAHLVKPNVKHFRSNALGFTPFKEIILQRNEETEL